MSELTIPFGTVWYNARITALMDGYPNQARDLLVPKGLGQKRNNLTNSTASSSK